jgi:hypothetical protein
MPSEQLYNGVERGTGSSLAELGGDDVVVDALTAALAATVGRSMIQL